MRKNFKKLFSIGLFCLSVGLFAQVKPVTGKVVDSDGFPVNEAYVYVEGKDQGVYTDADGNYTIEVEPGDKVTVDFIGFNKSTFSVDGRRTVYNIKLEKGGKVELEVVTALGIKKKADALTSSQQVVKSEELTQAGNPNVVQSLAGKVSGLQINQTNTGVVETSSIVLRGRRSITGNNQALIVIDGAISNANVLQQLPPELIEDVNVIKGAQGAALYGAQGVNGVIIVTTKSGAENEKINISVNSNYDFQDVAFIPKRQRNYGQGWDGIKINVENGAWGPRFGDPNLSGNVPYGLPLYDFNKDGKVDINPSDFTPTPDDPASIMKPYAPFGKNNVKDFFNIGTILSNDFTINAGSKGKFALLSVGNLKRKFVVQGDEQERTSLLFKGGAEMGKWSLSGGFNYITRRVTHTNSDLYHDLLQSSVDAPITMYKDYPDLAFGWNVYYNNPYWVIKHRRYNNTSNYFNSTANLGYNINEHISVNYMGNLQATAGDVLNYGDSWEDVLYPDVKSMSSWLYKSNDFSSRYYGDLIVNFDYDLTKDLGLKFNLGHNYQDQSYKITSAGGDVLDIPGLYAVYNIKKPTLPSNLSNGRYHKNSFAVFANVDLAYRNYLFLNATARKEWSSVLPKSQNSYFYPSFGVSFVPTKAFKGFKSDILNYMKISANWTRVGNSSSIGWYDVNSYGVIANGYPYKDGPLSFVNRTGPTNENIRPEFVTSTELALNVGLLKDRIILNGAIYKQETKDMITYQSTSRASGLVRNLINVGAMETKGYEVDLGINPVKTKDFKWDVNFSYTHAESIVTKVTDESDEVNLGSNSMVGIFAKVGQLFPLIKANAYQRDSQGRVIIDAATGNPLYTSDLVEFGTSSPKHIFGLTTSLKYKGIKLAAVMDYRKGNYFFTGVATDMAFNGGLYESGQFDRSKGGFVMPNSVYKDPTTGQYVPNTSIKTGGNDYQGVSTYYSSIYNRIGENFIIDGTAFKLRELSLSYSLPSKILDQVGLTEFTLGVYARNLFMKFAKDNLNYSDPETSSSNGNNQGFSASDQYPNLKTYGLSLNLKF